MKIVGCENNSNFMKTRVGLYLKGKINKLETDIKRRVLVIIRDLSGIIILSLFDSL